MYSPLLTDEEIQASSKRAWEQFHKAVELNNKAVKLSIALFYARREFDAAIDQFMVGKTTEAVVDLARAKFYDARREYLIASALLKSAIRCIH